MVKATKLKSGSWNIRAYSHKENGKPVYKSITAPTKAECEFKYAEFRKSQKRNKNNVCSLTVREAIEKYIKQSDVALSPTTIAGYKKILDYSFKSIMDLPIDKLDDTLMQNAINIESQRPCERKRDTTISPKTLKNEKGLLMSALASYGYRFNVKMPKVPRKIEILPEPIEVYSAIMNSNIELPCLIAMRMSLRLSEVMGLTCESVKDGLLRVEQVKVRVNGEDIVKNLAKTDESIRVLEIPPYIQSLINNTEAMKNYAKTGENAFLIDIPRETLRHTFYRLMKKANLDLSFHDLRHYYASISLNKIRKKNGEAISIKTVQVGGGWKTSQVPMEVYNHSFNDEQKELAEGMDTYYNDMITQAKGKTNDANNRFKKPPKLKRMNKI